MKKVMLVFLLNAAAVCALIAQDDNRKDPFLTKTFATESIKRAEVETSGGNISVERVPADKARVEVFIWPSDRRNGTAVSKTDIQRRLDEFYDLNITVSDNKLTAIAKPKNRKWDWKNALSISFKVFVTQNVSTNLTTSGGNINLTDVSGDQKIITSGGNLTIVRVSGKLRGTTSGGNIEVTASDNDIDLTTSGGNIEANNCKGEIKLVTSGGSLKLANLDGNVSATTSGGDVKGSDIKGDLDAGTSGGNIDLSALACNVTAGTSGGNIKVAIKEPGKLIKLRNSAGRIELQLPPGKGYDLDLSADKIKTDNLVNFNGKVEDNTIDGKLNGGGTQVSVRASSGKVILTFR